MTSISFSCPKCQESYSIQQKTSTSPSSAIPSPDISIFRNKFQDHGDHTVFLDITDGSVREFQIVPRLRSVFDTFLYDKIEVAKIINTLLQTTASGEKRLLLYVADPTSYHRFFRELSRRYTLSTNPVTIKKEQGIMVISHSSLVFILTDFDRAKTILTKGYQSMEITRFLGKSDLKSLVIDTSMMPERKLIKRLKKSKIRLEEQVNIILAFDYRRVETPPLDLREYFLDNYGSNSIELLNYQDTNGLKSIFLQSYYNMLEDPYEGREAFEIMQQSY